MIDQLKTHIVNCARCKGEHPELSLFKFKRDVNKELERSRITHWTTCPTTKEPILEFVEAE